MDDSRDKTDHLGIERLHSLLQLNSIKFGSAEAKTLPEPLGNALVYSPKQDEQDVPFLTIPTSAILCYQSVLSTLKNNTKLVGLVDKLEEDGWLNQNNPRSALILGLALAFRGVEVGGFWSSYVKFLPANVPLPTMWKEEERDALRGTSLEYALRAKLNALTREYLDFSALTKNNEIFGISKDEEDDEEDEEDEKIRSNMFSFKFYLHLDSLVRSRSLELPGFGTSLVPVLDLSNHSHTANAVCVLDETHGVVSLVESGEGTIQEGEQVCINYGAEKPPAEFLFSYGFIDESATVKTFVLPLFLGQDEPQARAKQQFLKKMPTVTLYEEKDKDATTVKWKSDGIWLLSLNYPDDPLEFLAAATTTGGHVIEVAFGGKQLDKPEDLKPILENASTGMWPVYRLRAVARILEAVDDALEKVVEAEMEYAQNPSKEEKPLLAHKLRALEGEFLANAVESLTAERDELLRNPVVVRYLEEMNAVPEAEAEDDEEDDFT